MLPAGSREAVNLLQCDCIIVFYVPSVSICSHTMSNAQDKAIIRQQSSENNSVSSSEWDMANDVFVSGYDDNPMGDGAAAVGDRDPAQPGLDRHLPPLSQDGNLLGLAGEEYSGSSYLSIDPNYTESDGNVTTKKRIRSNSSRHRGEVVTELGPEELRWFYKEDKRTWKPFVGHDSLKIEIVYRRFCEQNPDKVKYLVEPAEAEGKEAANSGEIQSESGAVDSSVRADPAVQRGGGRQRSTSEEMKEPDDISVSVEAVCVRGGLYEVDIREKECYPVYWNQQDRIPVMRGQWFIDGTWLPLEEDESDLIEMDHLSRFRGQQMRDTYEMEVVTTTVDSKDAIHSLKLSRSHVDWYSVDEVYLYSDATTSKIARTVTQKLGFSKGNSVKECLISPTGNSTESLTWSTVLLLNNKEPLFMSAGSGGLSGPSDSEQSTQPSEPNEESNRVEQNPVLEEGEKERREMRRGRTGQKGGAEIVCCVSRFQHCPICRAFVLESFTLTQTSAAEQ
ncbi:Phospholipase DDHD1 [Collichthys lucidus]|uniref:Phospholipase DDHD1 n=1 Tax=Collichthys lucidus TaxID=240159 RepID=A0A4U5UMV6_COLLU|nr:Phospholipase DDHD1 [Collichthys lucidus]